MRAPDPSGRNVDEPHVDVAGLGPPVGAHRDPAPAGGVGERRGAGVVGAGDERAAGRDAAEELVERGDVGGGAAVVVEVVGLDVRDDRDLRRVRQEGRVALVGLDHEDVAGALVGAGAGSGEIAADRERGVEPAVLQRHGEHRRGGGLAARCR